MKYISFKGRLLLRKILTGLSLGAVTFIFQACYGMPSGEFLAGTVKSSETEDPISGIQVTVKGNAELDTVETAELDSILTDDDGYYEFWLQKNDQSYFQSYIVLFQDIDGPENGEFEDKEVEWFSKSGPLNVTLDPKVDDE